MKKILILASNPRKDLDLDDEIRIIRQVINQNPKPDRDRFEVVSEPGVRVGDLQGLLLQHEPEIVHFCGHGGGEEGLIFKMDGGGEQWVQADALAKMFGLKRICSHVNCVLLNACYSEEQANAIVSSINYVVGMSHEIQDNAAIAFSKGFYLALGYECSIDDSFEFGKNAIQLEISGSSKMRSATTEAERKMMVQDAVANTPIPEHLKPILKKKASLSVNLSAISQQKRTEIQLEIDKTLEEEPKIAQYREQVKEYLKDRKLQDYQKSLLDLLRDELGLSSEQADRILEEELAPIHAAQQAYEIRLKALIKYYPFSDAIKNELKKFQAQRGLTDREVDEISKPILEAAEVFAEDLGNGVTLEMVKIPGGTFLMGIKDEEIERLCKKYNVDYLRREKPQHQVTVEPFFMGKYPITQAKWRAIAQRAELKVKQNLELDPSYFKGDDRPVEQVSWYDAVEFCARLSKLTKREYRLPSEAEWEYACRAGTTTPFYFGDTITDELANYDASYTYAEEPKGKYREETTLVGQFPPNAFGLYDMHGQVCEWCADTFHKNYNGAPSDGSAWIERNDDKDNDNQENCLRGGSWSYDPGLCRSAHRYVNYRVNRNVDVGFRVVCVGGRTV